MKYSYSSQRPPFVVENIDIQTVSRPLGYRHSFRNGRSKHGFIYTVSGRMCNLFTSDGAREISVSAGELVSLGLNIITLDNGDISIATLPGEDAISSISGGSFYVASAPSSSELLEKYFFAERDGFDKKRCFLHPSLESFKAIYQKKVENRVFLADEMK